MFGRKKFRVRNFSKSRTTIWPGRRPAGIRRLDPVYKTAGAEPQARQPVPIREDSSGRPSCPSVVSARSRRTFTSSAGCSHDKRRTILYPIMTTSRCL